MASSSPPSIGVRRALAVVLLISSSSSSSSLFCKAENQCPVGRTITTLRSAPMPAFVLVGESFHPSGATTTRMSAVGDHDKGHFDLSFGDYDGSVYCSRRTLLQQTLQHCLTGTTAFGLASNLVVDPATAVMMAPDNEKSPIFKAGEAMGTEAALKRFQLAREELDNLLSHYDSIVANGGGDNVRRYLGTVGVTSSLYGITKVLKELQEEADDIVEYTEAMNEFDSALRAADTACYSANFVEFSAAKTRPDQFFADAKQEILRMKSSLESMSKELK